MSFNSSVSARNRRYVQSEAQNSGQIQVIFGPMFSGKTTELMRRLKRYQIANYRCLIVRYAKDTRYDEQAIASHDGQKLHAVSAIKLFSNKFNEEEDRTDVFGIDEGQFFPDIVEFAEKMANKGKIVIVAALDADYLREPFGRILELVPIAEDVIKLTAVCMSCFKDASFTKRVSAEQEVEVIGGADKYMSLCRECYSLSNVVKNSPYKTTPELNGNLNYEQTPITTTTDPQITKNLFPETNNSENNTKMEH